MSQIPVKNNNPTHPPFQRDFHGCSVGLGCLFGSLSWDQTRSPKAASGYMRCQVSYRFIFWSQEQKVFFSHVGKTSDSIRFHQVTEPRMGGIIYTLASKLLVVMKIDDPVDASPVDSKLFFLGPWWLEVLASHFLGLKMGTENCRLVNIETYLHGNDYCLWLLFHHQHFEVPYFQSNPQVNP